MHGKPNIYAAKATKYRKMGPFFKKYGQYVDVLMHYYLEVNIKSPVI